MSQSVTSLTLTLHNPAYCYHLFYVQWIGWLKLVYVHLLHSHYSLDLFTYGTVNFLRYKTFPLKYTLWAIIFIYTTSSNACHPLLALIYSYIQKRQHLVVGSTVAWIIKKQSFVHSRSSFLYAVNVLQTVCIIPVSNCIRKKKIGWNTELRWYKRNTARSKLDFFYDVGDWGSGSRVTTKEK